MPTRKTLYWLVSAAVLYLIAWNVGSGWLYVLTTLLLSLPLLSLFINRINLRGLATGMKAPSSLTAGETLPAVLEIGNRSRLPRFMLQLDYEFAGSSEKLFVPMLGPRQTLRVDLDFVDVRRGVYSGGAIDLCSASPVGLARSRRRLKAACPLVVYPAWHALAGDWTSGQKNTGYMVSSAIPTRHTASDYLGVRDYRPGDSPRSIHWRSAARTGNLAVIEYARQSAITPVFLVDNFSDANRGEGADSSFETAVTIAASLAQRECRHNRRFGIGSSPEDAAVRGLSHSSDEAMYWLAQIEADSGKPMDFTRDALPWPEVTPVLILTSHSAYSQLDQTEFLRAFPHAIVIMLDGNGFEKTAGGNAAPPLMDAYVVEGLRDRLEAAGAEFIHISSIEEAQSCLEDL